MGKSKLMYSYCIRRNKVLWKIILGCCFRPDWSISKKQYFRYSKKHAYCFPPPARASFLRDRGFTGTRKNPGIGVMLTVMRQGIAHMLFIITSIPRLMNLGKQNSYAYKLSSGSASFTSLLLWNWPIKQSMSPDLSMMGPGAFTPARPPKHSGTYPTDMF